VYAEYPRAGVPQDLYVQLADANGNRISTPRSDSYVSVACTKDPQTRPTLLHNVTAYGSVPGEFCDPAPALVSNSGGVWRFQVTVRCCSPLQLLDTLYSRICENCGNAWRLTHHNEQQEG
jgi:hypothetical protein